MRATAEKRAPLLTPLSLWRRRQCVEAARNWNAADQVARILAERERERIAAAVRALREALCQ